MSTWISRAAVLAALTLAACVPAGGGDEAARLRVLGGTFTVAGPPGYCPDPSPASAGEDSAVVLIGRCAQDAGVPPAVLSVAVGAPGSGGVMAADGEALAAFFASDTGRALIGRNGRPQDVRVLTALREGDIFVMRVEDRAQGTYWRAMSAISGRLVSVSALGNGLPDEAGRVLLRETVAALRQANGAT